MACATTGCRCRSGGHQSGVRPSVRKGKGEVQFNRMDAKPTKAERLLLKNMVWAKPLAHWQARYPATRSLGQARLCSGNVRSTLA
eukprot:scaffold207202_cov36-Tisochrysis_lutea.AAC.3